MSKFKAMTFSSLKRYAQQAGMGSATDSDRAVMRDFMFMCKGCWTENELAMAVGEGIISEEDRRDLQADDILLN